MRTQHFRHLTAALLAVGLVSPAMLLTGCGGGDNPLAANGSGTELAQASKASMTMSVTFPPQGVSAARIDDATTAIQVMVWDVNACETDEGQLSCYNQDKARTVTLVRPVNGGTVTATLDGLVPGEGRVMISQLRDAPAETALPTSANDNTQRLYTESVNVSVKLAEGANRFAVNLITAAWTLQTPVTFNKTLATDDTRLDSFSIKQGGYHGPYATAAQKTSSTEDVWRGMSSYAAIAKGANLCQYSWPTEQPINGTNTEPTLACDQATLRGGWLYYYNRFDGTDSSKNYSLLEASGGGYYYNEGGSEDMPLRTSGGKERFWTMVSTLPNGQFPGDDDELDMTTFSDPDFIKQLSSTVTDGSTVAGNLLEVLIHSETPSNRKCFSKWEDGVLKDEITCPSPEAAAVQPQKASASASAQPQKGNTRSEGLVNAMTSNASVVKKSAADANGCFRNMTVSYKDWWWNYTGQAPNYGYYIVEDVTEVVDACLHSFTAKASQLPADDFPDTGMID